MKAQPNQVILGSPFYSRRLLRFDSKIFRTWLPPQGCSPFRHYSDYYQIFGYLNVLGRSFYKNLALVIRPSFIVGALWAPEFCPRKTSRIVV